MLGTLPPTNWSQISEEIPSLLVIMFHKEWDSGEGRREEKGGGSQTSVTTGTWDCTMIWFLLLFMVGVQKKIQWLLLCLELPKL